VTCKHCGAADDHKSDRDRAVQVFIDNYHRSKCETLYEFAAMEFLRQLRESNIILPRLGYAKELPEYLHVVLEGTFELALEAQEYLRKHSQ
jgi:hypothetical protein